MMEDSTISYYDRQAMQYFQSTVRADVAENCERFLGYVPPGGRIIDLGAGSGRDMLYFKKRGYFVSGIDASAELCRLASEYTGIEVACQRIQDWRPEEKYDGIWANASLLHLELSEIEDFILRAGSYLEGGGVLYISMKEGIPTGTDAAGRYFTGITAGQLAGMAGKSNDFSILEIWRTEDALHRLGFSWANMLLGKKL